MIIAIDLRALASGRGGIHEYILRLVPELVRLDRSIKFKLFFNSYSQKLRWLEDEPNGEWHQFAYPNRWLMFSSRIFFGPKLDQLVGGADVWFTPHLFVTALSPRCKQVITFHDLAWLRYPEFFTRRQNWWHRWQAPGLQAKRAGKLIAVSQSTADDLREFYNLPAEKISVIHSGIGSEFFEVRPQLIEDGPQRNLPEKYFLSLGTIEPRKNIAGVVRAFDTLKTSGQVGADAHLVIAGNLGWDYAEVKNLITKSSWQKQIKLLGAIKPENLPELYQRAKVFVYPSFFEGFGFPPLEAMASGVPVIAGNNSSFPETLGQAALLVDSYSQTELATAMAAAWNDQSLRSKLIANGQKQSKNFSWQKAAEETLSVLIRSAQ